MCRPIGTHVKVGKGLVAGALRDGLCLGAEVVQMFAGNPRGWAHSAGHRDRDSAFRDATAEAGGRVVIHSPYLVNLGSPTAATYERSVASIAHNLRRALGVGGGGVVVPPGSWGGGRGAVGAAMRQVRAGLLPLLDVLPEDGPWGLLEATAGQGRSLCAGVED